MLPDKRTGGWLFKIPVGRYPNGRTRYVEVRGATQAECVEKAKSAKAPDPKAVTVGEWAARWIAGLSNRSSTRAVYAHSVTSRVVPALGHVRLADLTVSQVKAAAAKWIGEKSAGLLAPQTANTTLDRAATMFAAAVTDGLATANPFALCPRFEYRRKAIDPLSPDELRQVVEARDRITSGHLFAFLAVTGCRIGEGVALDVTDYDRTTGAVSVTKTFNPDHGIGPPKSKHSRRVLVLPAVGREVVEEAIGKRVKGVLFGTGKRRRFHYSQLHEAFPWHLKALGLRERSPHALRHGCATALVAAGVPIADVARWLGDSVATVVKTYLHPSGADVAGALGAILSGDRPASSRP